MNLIGCEISLPRSNVVGLELHSITWWFSRLVLALIVEKAQQDLVIRRHLKFRPRETIEKFPGVKIPEVVGISVIVETPRNFDLPRHR